ncbi:MAG: hypothetical protein K9H26_10710 [Prolixibacteraceae bacterium]|nr:hypothetical protein [Prolixibacteraceae bacterium]
MTQYITEQQLQLATDSVQAALMELNEAKAALNNWINFPSEYAYYDACMVQYNSALAWYEELLALYMLQGNDDPEIITGNAYIDLSISYLPMIIAGIMVLIVAYYATKK